MNYIFKIAALFIGMAITHSSFAQKQEMTLEQAVNYALTNSLEMRDAQLKVLDADAVIKENLAIGLPQLSGSAQHQYYLKVPQQPLPESFQLPGAPETISFILKNNFTAAANLDAMIFDGAYFVALKASRAASTYAQIELTNRQKTLRQQVRDAYLPLLLLQANTVQLDKNIANLDKVYQETKSIFEAGFAEQLDVDRLELSLANLQTEQENLSRQYEMALRLLKFTINMPEAEELKLTDDLENMAALPPQMSAAGAGVNFDQFPEMRLVDQTLHLQDLNLKVQKAGYLPSLRAFGGYQYQYQGDKLKDGFWAPTAFVGFNLAIPLYDGGYKKAKVQRVQIAIDRAMTQRQSLQQLFSLQVENAQDAYSNAKDRLADREKNLALANRIYDTTQIKYREGVGSSLEVNQAEQALYTAQTNRLQALYELLSAKIDLAEALGQI